MGEVGGNRVERQVRKLRLWPAIVILVIQLSAMYGPGLLVQLQAEPPLTESGVVVEQSFVDNPQVVLFAKMLGPAVGTLLLFLWWIGVSRASWQARIIGPLVAIGLGWAALKFMHPTMGLGFLLYAVPSATTGGVVALFLLRRLPLARCGTLALVAIGVVLGFWTLIRLDGVDGDLNADLSLRWSRTAEQNLLAERAGTTSDPIASLLARQTTVDAAWPGFRGVRRDGRLTGIRIESDWGDDGLSEHWRTPVGPGWSSFAVAADRIFTQEQRGDHEVVAAYDVASGQQVWVYRDETRFSEFISGVGPRATPTFAAGRLYTIGAKGIVNCLDPWTGTLIWSRDLVADTGAGVPMWGFSSSPLVVDGKVVVFAGAGRGKSVVAYDAESGDVRWTAGDGWLSYSSAQRATLHEVPQILMMTELGLSSFAAETGERLWRHDWSLGGGSARIVQPAVIGNDVLIGTGYGQGTRRISVALEDGTWSTRELWTSRALKPYFNDFVVDGDYAYGFDGSIFTCVDLKTGERLWKRGRYGSGQVLLVAEQKLLLVLSEEGELILLSADPKRHEELYRFEALEGKTWNHPVVADGRLFVRNGSEAASYDIRVRAE